MTTLQVIRQELGRRQSLFDQKVGMAKAINRHKIELEKEIVALSGEVVLLGKVLSVLHTLSEAVQDRFLRAIENLISDGLSAVFESPIKFRIHPTVRNSQVNLDFVLENGDGTTTDLMDSRGGGLVSLCGVLLRVVMVRLMKDRVRQLLILDEPLAMLSSEYVPAAGELLAKLSSELDMQILMVTHQPDFIEASDSAFRLVARPDGVKVVKEK